MYYPYLRGRQNELLAIRELIEKSILSNKVIPVIEPVKLSSTLLSTMTLFNDKNARMVFIENPKVGSFFYDTTNDRNSGLFEKIKEIVINSNSISRGFIADNSFDSKVHALNQKGINNSEIICLCQNVDSLRTVEEYLHSDITFMIPYAPVFRRIQTRKILLDDSFNKQQRNMDYLENEDEFFSNNHLYYQEEGYDGFSDYSIVGEEYNESGFSPYAVAIHIVYFDDERNLRIHHFVSDDNNDIQDPAGKFYQALEKFIIWNRNMQLNTLAARQFEQIYEDQSYPGLGYIKKLSIMHHLELMSSYLEGEI